MAFSFPGKSVHWKAIVSSILTLFRQKCLKQAICFWKFKAVRKLVRPPTAKVVKQMESKSALQEVLDSAGDKLVVVDFSATWYGPCKMIKPFFCSLSEKYSSVLMLFLEVDVDNCQDISADCEIKCMPNFQFFKGQKVGEFSRANKEKLETTINELL
ncbi:thioredoxin-like [Ochotona princeps]|uniref:thioredoxin-like n=1 Tax=Ochotona princeps TaxID=9978 RepID=UPI00271518C4|nr:thioredoxin-like [Ochotona princeps]